MAFSAVVGCEETSSNSTLKKIWFLNPYTITYELTHDVGKVVEVTVEDSFTERGGRIKSKRVSCVSVRVA